MSSESNDFQRAEWLMDEVEKLNTENPKLLKKVLQKRNGLKSEEFNELFDLFEDMHLKTGGYDGVKTKTKGKVLEKLIEKLTIETKLFKLFRNVSSDTNEYDIIITPSDFARSSHNALPNILFQPIICECKNYNKAVDVTWIGKLYMLLSIADIKVGVIFSYNGVTDGNNKDEDHWQDKWKNAQGLIKKIFLKDNISIIDISVKELRDIKDGKSFYEILEEKYNDFQIMANLEDYKVTHESASKVTDIIKQVEEEVSKCSSCRGKVNSKIK